MYCPRVSLPVSDGGTYIRDFDIGDPNAHGRDADNGRTVAISVISWTALLADSPIDSVKPRSVVHRFCNKLVDDFFSVVAEFADLAHKLTFTFRRSTDGFTSQWIEGFEKTPIFREYLAFYRTADPKLLQWILSFLLFGKKISYSDPSLDATSLRGWLAKELELGLLTLPPWVKHLRSIMQVLLQEWDPTVFLPVNGGGAVSERKVRGTVAKIKNFATTPSIDYLYGADRTWSFDAGTSYPSQAGNPLFMSHRPSRLKFVPKDYRKTRSICMEPIGLMWAQQGVRLWYEQVFEDGILNAHVSLHDQRVNQWASKFGSFTTDLDTIDLSAASDSMAWSLIRAIMPPQVLKHLLATRSSVVELPGGELHKLQKFAPMGSALCFPVQTSVYAGITILAALLTRWHIDLHDLDALDGLDLIGLYHRTFKPGLEHRESDDERFHPFYVYGDDIICDSRITSNVMDLLGSLGFDVNKEKSYTGDVLFRESCGVFAFNGYDVTPLTFKPKAVRQKLDSDSLASFIETANLAGDYGYTNLQRHLIQFILHYPIQGVRTTGLNPILFSESRDDALSLFSINPRNTHLVKRAYERGMTGAGSHIDLQRTEYKRLIVAPSRVSTVKRRTASPMIGPQPNAFMQKVMDRRRGSHADNFCDNYLYTRWCRSRYRVEESDAISAGNAEVESLGTRLVVAWTAAT